MVNTACFDKKKFKKHPNHRDNLDKSVGRGKFMVLWEISEIDPPLGANYAQVRIAFIMQERGFILQNGGNSSPLFSSEQCYVLFLLLRSNRREERLKKCYALYKRNARSGRGSFTG